MVGNGLSSSNQSQNGGNMNFGAMSNSSHYNNPGGLQAGLIGKVAPSSGGYMGQGLGILGRLEPGSEGSSSFYSNNTSYLNNSRYLQKPMGNKMVGAVGNVGKVMPILKQSIDNTVGYGSHTSNFPHDQNSKHGNGYPAQ